MSSAYPRMAASGVRNSWLMLATNCDLCWLAISRSSIGLASSCVRLHFFEQPCVLNGDDSLVGERFNKLDLLRGERSNCRSDQHHYANWVTFSHQRNREKGAHPLDRQHRSLIVFWISSDVIDLQGSPRRQCASNN